MDKLKTLMSLNEAKDLIEELIAKTKVSTESSEAKEERSGSLLIPILCIIGSLAIIAVVAYLVYKHFSDDYLDDYEDLDDLFDDEEDEDEEDEDPEVITSDDDFEDEFDGQE